MLKNIIYLAISITAFSLAYSIAFLTEIDLVKSAILYAFVIQWVLFVPAYLLKTEKFYDLSGSLTYIFVVSYVSYNYYLIDGVNFGNIIIGLAIIFWAVRLGSLLFLRIHKAGEDRRFRDIKKSLPKFLMTWTLSALWVFLTTVNAITIIALNPLEPVGVFFVLGTVLWLLGFGFEVVADRQKKYFSEQPENIDRFISHGLWSVSRHPNYFGEIILWTGIAIISLPFLSSWQFVSLVSPLFVFLLLTRISGLPFLEEKAEKKWGKDKAYVEYKNKTPILIPFFGKRH